MAIALYVDDDRVSESEFATRDGGDEGLKGVQRAAVSPDQEGEIAADDVQDDLTFVALVLLDRRVLDPESTEDGLERLDRGVGDAVEVLIGERGV